VQTVRYEEGDGANSWGSMTQLTTESSGRPALTLENGAPVLVFPGNDWFYFMKKNGSSWTQAIAINKSPSNSLSTQLFANGGNSYDLFYRAPEDTVNYRYNVKFLGFSVNLSNNQSQILKDTWLIYREANQDVRLYSVRRNLGGLYHLLYIKQNTATYGDKLYHSIFDGQDIYFTTLLTSENMNVLEYPAPVLAENNNVVSAYFNGPLDGSVKPMFNVADFAPIINYRLSQTAPINGTVINTGSADLKWTFTAVADSYNVSFGQDPNSLASVAQNITATTTRVNNLLDNQSYYWQVEARISGQSVYSNIWHFNTGTINTPPSLAIIKPGGSPETVDSNYTIQWLATDPDNNAHIRLFFDTNNAGQDGTAINLVDINEDDNPAQYSWDTSNVPDGSYYIYGTIDDGVNPVVVSYSTVPLVINHTECHIPAAGDWQLPKSCTLTSSASAPAGVIVPSGAVLTVSAEVVLKIDLKHYKLLVRKGGGVLIKKGGTIKQN
jgi:hypothetical protein